jgi:DNA primase
MNINKLLDRLHKGKQTGQEKWVACCPAHDDRSPSLGITIKDDKVLIKCFSGCGATEILDAVGLDYSVLFPEAEGKLAYKPKFNKSELFDKLLEQSSILREAVDIFIYRNLTEDEWSHALNAIETIDNIRTEVRRGNLYVPKSIHEGIV